MNLNISLENQKLLNAVNAKERIREIQREERKKYKGFMDGNSSFNYLLISLSHNSFKFPIFLKLLIPKFLIIP